MEVSKFAFRTFGEAAERIAFFFPALATDLKTSKLRYSVKEYVSLAIFYSCLAFVFSMPALSVVLTFFLLDFLFSLLSALTLSIFLAGATFLFFIYRPRLIASSLARRIDKELPFATLFLSTLTGGKFPLHKNFELFEKFGGYEQLGKEIRALNNDVRYFGLDINTALEREIERCPSKQLQELLWGILSTQRAGGDVSEYLKEKSRGFFEEYRRKLSEFSRSLTVYIEIYLTSIILGTIFFVVLTSVFAGMAGVAGQIVFLQFFLIFGFLPMIAFTFALLIKSAAAQRGE